MAHVQSPIVTLGYGFRAILRLSSVHVTVYSDPTIGFSSFVNRSKDRTTVVPIELSQRNGKRRNPKDIDKRNDLYNKNPRIRFYGQSKLIRSEHRAHISAHVINGQRIQI